MDFIKEKDIREGDYVKIYKAGEIIPEIDRVLKENEMVLKSHLKFRKSVRYAEALWNVLPAKSLTGVQIRTAAA